MSVIPYTPIPEHSHAVDWNDVQSKPSIFPSEDHSHTSDDVSGLAVVATSGSYNDLSNKPSMKRVDTYLGTTNASGDYSVTYAVPFNLTPDVQPQLQAGTPSQEVRITSSTINGFTVKVTNRASVNLLGVDVLLAATTNVNGASVGVLVTERDYV